MRTCKIPFCPNYAEPNRLYCQQHLVIKPKRKRSTADSNITQHYNTTEWKSFSKKMITKQPYCSICQSEQNLVLDHWVMSAWEMINTFGQFVLDETMYRVLCVSCNSKRRGVIRALPNNNTAINITAVNLERGGGKI